MLKIKKLSFYGIVCMNLALFGINSDQLAKVERYAHNLTIFDQFCVRKEDQKQLLLDAFGFEPTQDKCLRDRQINLSSAIINLNVESMYYCLQESVHHDDDIWPAYFYVVGQISSSLKPKAMQSRVRNKQMYDLFPLKFFQLVMLQTKYEVDLVDDVRK